MKRKSIMALLMPFMTTVASYAQVVMIFLVFCLEESLAVGYSELSGKGCRVCSNRT